MYIFIFTEYLMRLILGNLKSKETTGIVPGGVANYVFIPLAIILFLLLIDCRKTSRL